MKLTPLSMFLLAALVASCSGGAADTIDDTAPVETTPTETEIEPASTCPNGAEATQIPLPMSTGEPLMVQGLEHDRIWNNDLNGDNIPDMILQQRGACNANDECTDSVWLGCTGDTFALVWGPDFAYELYVLEEFHDHDGTQWVTLERLTVDAAGDTKKETLHFNGSSYEEVE